MSRANRFDQHPDKALTGKQAQAVHLLALGNTNQTAVAKTLGISQATLSIWVRQPNFAKALRIAQGLQEDGTDRLLTKLRRRAARTTGQLLNSANESVRLKAALGLLEHAGRSREHGALAGKIEELEQAIRAASLASGATEGQETAQGPAQDQDTTEALPDHLTGVVHRQSLNGVP